MNSTSGRPADVPTERRKNLRGREIFDEVVERLRPFVDDTQGWNGSPLEFWASRTLREAYPDLESDEIRPLVVAALQVCRGRTKSD